MLKAMELPGRSFCSGPWRGSTPCSFAEQVPGSSRLGCARRTSLSASCASRNARNAWNALFARPGEPLRRMRAVPRFLRCPLTPRTPATGANVLESLLSLRRDSLSDAVGGVPNWIPQRLSRRVFRAMAFGIDAGESGVGTGSCRVRENIFSVLNILVVTTWGNPSNSTTFRVVKQFGRIPNGVFRSQGESGRWHSRLALRDGGNPADSEESQPVPDDRREEALTMLNSSLSHSAGTSVSPGMPNVKYVGVPITSEQSGASPWQTRSSHNEYSNGAIANPNQYLNEARSYESISKPYKNRLLGLSKIKTLVSDAAERFFKSEIRRRTFVTFVLIMASRLGYFIPIPGFDRRFMSGDYLALVSGAVEELGDLVSELKLAVFQLGISPYIFSSIIMQVSTHLFPALVKLRKEGLDGNEKIKKYTWWLAIAIAIVESLLVAIHSAQYSVYGLQNRVTYILVSTGILTSGAATINWICEKITEAGFGQGSSLIICISILTGYSENLHKMISNLLNGTTSWVPLSLFLGCFFLITVWAVIVTEGRRKVKLQYYDFELASRPGRSSILPEVEPYIPFNINPTGMQPVLTTTYLMAIPSLIAGLTKDSGWIRIRDTLNPTFPALPGAMPWLYYLLNAIFIFLFNVLDIMDTPKEVADYMMKIGARIPSVKPGKLTIEFLTKVQASTRFWGGILLAMLATVSTLMDYRFRSLHQGGTIGFTSMLIIVGSIVELRRSFMAYNVMPSLSKVLRRNGV